jgi:AcrR family transcriptional regulator
MNKLLLKLKIYVSDQIYLKDPETSDLGKKIISEGINLIDEMGFENFTFRKLGEKIDSTETSIYRYFESKHKLLLYLTSWYWGWLEYRLVFGLANISSPEERLSRAIAIITDSEPKDFEHPFIDLEKLSHIIISESSKTYLTQNVDKENQEGVFEGYKQLVGRISEIIREINPDYPYARMLVSTIMEGSNHLRFFSEHLPLLLDQNSQQDIAGFYTDMVFKSIKKD